MNTIGIGGGINKKEKEGMQNSHIEQSSKIGKHNQGSVKRVLLEIQKGEGNYTEKDLVKI